MRVLLLGGNGLVGQGVLHALQAAHDVERIVLLARRRAGVAGPRVEAHRVQDLATVHAQHPALQALDACVNCIGVLPGLSEAAFSAVTFDLNLQLARAFAQANPRGMLAYVSGAGADPASPVMPLRVKGRIEAALRELPIATVMLRPGVVQPVDGVRSPHALRDAGYRIGAPLLGLARGFAPRMVTTSTQVGIAALAALRERRPGQTVLDNAAINRAVAG